MEVAQLVSAYGRVTAMRRVGLLALGCLALGCAREPDRLGSIVHALAERAHACVHAASLRQQAAQPAPSASVAQNPGSVVFADAGTFHKCYAGFAASGDPSLDVMRLGLMCGPVNGMKLGLDVAGSPEGSEEHRVDVRAGDCFRVMAAAARGVGPLTIEVLENEQRLVARASTSSWVIVDADHPFCSSEAVTYRVRVTIPAARDAGAAAADAKRPAYALQVWRLRL